MAAIGSDCAVSQKLAGSAAHGQGACYPHRLMKAYTDKDILQHKDGCSYRKGYGITGVLCCQKWTEKDQERLMLRYGHKQAERRHGKINVELLLIGFKYLCVE